MLRTIFEHAARRGLIAANPARGARKVADRKRTKRLSLEQIGQLGVAIRGRPDESGPGLPAIRLILLTGFRRSEALGIRRDWLMAAGGVDFPDTKSGPQARPIGKRALKLLRSQFVADEQDWAFPAERGAGHFVGLPKVLARVCNEAKLVGVTAHMLRHTFASIAADLGYSVSGVLAPPFGLGGEV